MTVMMGSRRADELIGTSGNDRVYGLGHDDRIWGQGGDDVLVGGSGEDRMFGGDGADRLHGDGGADALSGDDGDDILFGGGGADRLSGGLGADLLDAGTGADILQAGADDAPDILLGGAGDDRIDDVRVGDVVYGHTGDDAIVVELLGDGSGVATAILGPGRDTLSLDASTEALGRQTLLITDFAVGARGDTLDVTGLVDAIAPGAPPSEDSFDPTRGVLRWRQEGDDAVLEVAADPVGFVAAARLMDVRVDALTGANLITGYDPITAPPSAKDAERGAVLIGAAGADTLLGAGGDDLLDGMGGADRLFGGAGDDLFRARPGAELFDGGAGVDRVTYDTARAVNVFLDGSGTNARDAVGDVLVSIERIVGGDHATEGDFIVGDDAHNLFKGLGGNDRLWGRAGRDSLDGGAGDDELIGGAGGDQLLGGAGADRFVFTQPAGPAAERDTIWDFESGVDRLEIRVAFFDASLDPEAAPILVAGSAPQAQTAGAFLYDTDDGRLLYDADGAGGAAALHVAFLAGAPSLLASDIVFA